MRWFESMHSKTNSVVCSQKAFLWNIPFAYWMLRWKGRCKLARIGLKKESDDDDEWWRRYSESREGSTAIEKISAMDEIVLLIILILALLKFLVVERKKFEKDDNPPPPVPYIFQLNGQCWHEIEFPYWPRSIAGWKRIKKEKIERNSGFRKIPPKVYWAKGNVREIWKFVSQFAKLFFSNFFIFKIFLSTFHLQFYISLFLTKCKFYKLSVKILEKSPKNKIYRKWKETLSKNQNEKKTSEVFKFLN